MWACTLLANTGHTSTQQDPFSSFQWCNKNSRAPRHAENFHNTVSASPLGSEKCSTHAKTTRQFVFQTFESLVVTCAMQDSYQILWISDTYISSTPANKHLSDSRNTCLGNYLRRARAFIAAKTLPLFFHTKIYYYYYNTLTRPTRRDSKTGFAQYYEVPFKLRLYAGSTMPQR